MSDLKKAALVSQAFSDLGISTSADSGISLESRTGRTIISRPVPSPRAVARFKELYRQQRGVDLSEDEALELATRYLQLFVFGITPPPGTDQCSDTTSKSP